MVEQFTLKTHLYSSTKHLSLKIVQHMAGRYICKHIRKKRPSNLINLNKFIYRITKQFNQWTI